jgi:hypothetical protein
MNAKLAWDLGEWMMKRGNRLDGSFTEPKYPSSDEGV